MLIERYCERGIDPYTIKTSQITEKYTVINPKLQYKLLETEGKSKHKLAHTMRFQ